MSNFQALITDIGRELDFDPKVLATRDDRANVVNRVYLDVSASHEWLFLQIVVDWKVWHERTGTNTSETATVTNGTYEVTISGPLGVPWSRANMGQEWWDTEDESTATKYTINRITGVGITTLWLDRPYEGSSTVLTEWKVPGRRFYLPDDCGRALRFVDREQNFGPMVVIDRRREEDWLSWTTGNQGTVLWIVEDDTIYLRPPDPGWALTASTAAGTLPADSMWEVCYTFAYRGFESAPSTVLRVTVGSGATNQIAITLLEDTQVSSLDTGIWKNVYVRQITSDATTDVQGRWLLFTTLTEAQTGALFASPSAADRNSQLLAETSRKFMGTEWAPSSDQTMRLRYVRLPIRLVSDSDSPQWPGQYHQLLVLGAAKELAAKYGLTARLPGLEKRYDRMLLDMKGAQLIVPASPTQRERMDMGGRGRVPYRTNGPCRGDFGG